MGIKVRFQGGLEDVSLHYACNGSWASKEMRLADGWWTAEVDSPVLDFTFSDKGGSWWPGGVGNNLRTSCAETWVRDGVLYPHDPDERRPDDLLLVMTLNLHTWQETDAYAKVMRVAEVVRAIRPDFVCLQECGQRRGGGEPVRGDNPALLIAKAAPEYHFVWDWAHYGFTHWEEGLAVLTPHHIVDADSRWISEKRDVNTIESRKAVYLAAEAHGRRFHVFSVHLNWQGTQPIREVRRLKKWVASKGEADATIIAGDFNLQPHSEAIPEMAPFVNAWTSANGTALEPTYIDDGEKLHIDYVFHDNGVRKAEIVQTWFRHAPGLGGRVSDHVALLAWLRT